jgi:sugar diacid utilization regulator
VLQQDLGGLAEMPTPHLMPLQPSPIFPAGIWIVWTASSQLPGEAVACLERVLRTLEAVLEVEGSEEIYFSENSPLRDRALVDALAQGDANALSVFLSLTRLVGKAEFTFWGRAYHDVVEVSSHQGARQSEFGFVLSRGHGVGGRIAAYGTPIVIVGDYRNSPYRDTSVSGVVDGEQIRSALALPVRYYPDRETRAREVAAVLYATRRTITPFSLAERLLVQRLIRLLEPLPLVDRPVSFPSSGMPQLPDQKAAWYDLVLHANRIESLEAWAGQFIQGTVIVTDCDRRPYVLARTEQLEQLRATFGSPTNAVQILSLYAPGLPMPGQVYLRGSVQLPPPYWPDFFSDLAMACNLIIARMEKAHDHLAREREQWIQALLQEKAAQQIIREGYRLGLPVEQGQLWVIAWPAQTMSARELVRKRMLAESIVLDHLKSPLIFFSDDLGVILFDDHIQQQPSRLRDALLKQCAPHPLWIVYGAHYRSLHDLKMTLTRAFTLARKARRETRSEYLLDIQTPRLDGLLENPRLAEDLRDFAARLLAPLLEYDTTKGSSDLTTTFVLMQTLGSAQAVADQLAVHVNTIRYRLHKAEDMLGIELAGQASTKDRTAWALAAFIWERFQLAEQTLAC